MKFKDGEKVMLKDTGHITKIRCEFDPSPSEVGGQLVYTHDNVSTPYYHSLGKSFYIVEGVAGEVCEDNLASVEEVEQ